MKTLAVGRWAGNHWKALAALVVIVAALLLLTHGDDPAPPAPARENAEAEAWKNEAYRQKGMADAAGQRVKELTEELNDAKQQTARAEAERDSARAERERRGQAYRRVLDRPPVRHAFGVRSSDADLRADAEALGITVRSAAP